eukprot:1153994-Pelagomonas_calceolata.AAC.6
MLSVAVPSRAAAAPLLLLFLLVDACAGRAAHAVVHARGMSGAEAEVSLTQGAMVWDKAERNLLLCANEEQTARSLPIC